MATIRRDNQPRAQIRIAPGIDVSGLATAANVQRLRVTDNRALDAFATQVQDFAFERGAIRRQAEGEAAAPTTFERKLIESRLNIDGEVRVIRDEAGAIAPELPSRNSISIFDQAYRKATLARYGEQIYRDARGTIGRLAQENRLNPKAFAELSDQYIDSVAENALPDARPYITQQMRSLQSGHFSRIEAQKASNDYRETVSDLTIGADEAIKDISNLVASGASLTYNEASASGTVRKINAEMTASFSRFAQMMSQLNEIGAISNGEMAQAFTGLNQRISMAHMMSAARGIPGTPEGELELLKATRSFLSGKSQVELPTMDEQGNIQVITQSAASLWNPDDRTKIANGLMAYWKSHSELDRAKKELNDEVQRDAAARFLTTTLLSAMDGNGPTAEDIAHMSRIVSDPRTRLSMMNALTTQVNIARAARERLGNEALDRRIIEHMGQTISRMDEASKVQFTGAFSALIDGLDDPASTLNTRAQIAAQLTTQANAWIRVQKENQSVIDEIDTNADIHAAGGSGQSPKEKEFAYSGSLFDMFVRKRAPDAITAGGAVSPDFYLDPNNFNALREAIVEDQGRLGKTFRYAPPPQISDYLVQVLGMSPDTPGIQQHRANAIQLRKDLARSPGTVANMASASFMSEGHLRAYDALDEEMSRGNSEFEDDTWMKAREVQAGVAVDPKRESFLSDTQRRMVEEAARKVGNDGHAITQRLLDDLVSNVRRRMPTTELDSDEVENIAQQELAMMMQTQHIAPSRIMVPDVRSRLDKPQLSVMAPHAVYPSHSEEFFAAIAEDQLTRIQDNPVLQRMVGQPLLLGKNTFLQADMSAVFDRPEDVKYRLIYFGMNSGRAQIIPDFRPNGDPNRPLTIDFKPHVLKSLSRRIPFAGSTQEFEEAGAAGELDISRALRAKLRQDELDQMFRMNQDALSP